MDGILVIDKPAGPTSHDVVSRVRRALGQKKIGHTGTLDPVATGVLPLVVGHATKVARYLTGSDKKYRATVRLGTNTDTLDGEGQVVQTREITAVPQDVEACLEVFRGTIEQIPPMFSAKKLKGKRLYELARKGVEVEREPKSVTIRSLDLVSCSLPDITLDVVCSAGTYVRVLAQDIGERLGCGGYLQALRRVAAGPFTLTDAITLDDAERKPEDIVARVLPLTRALSNLPRIDVPPSLGRMIASGYQLTVADLRTLDVPDFLEGATLTLGLDGSDLIAISRSLMSAQDLWRSRRDTRALKTERVFRHNL